LEKAFVQVRRRELSEGAGIFLLKREMRDHRALEESLAIDREVALAVLQEAAEGGLPRRPRSAELRLAILREGYFELWSSEML